jgi:hypothetical protein
VLPAGALHPDLVNRLVAEATKSAQHVLNMCIRALDYCPPVDLTFGDYLRAIITADSDLVPDDDLGYRVAVIEAFRRRGIYPRDVRTLSLDSLRWPSAREAGPVADIEALGETLRRVLADKLSYVDSRQEVFNRTKAIRLELHGMLQPIDLSQPALFEGVTGLVLSGDAGPLGLKKDSEGRPSFEVHSLRRARRVGPDGDALDQVIISITQRRILDSTTGGPAQPDAPSFNFRGGVTLILDLDTLRLRYVIRKSINDSERLQRQLAYLQGGRGGSLRATYFGDSDTFEPFALLHRSGLETVP